MTKYGDLSREGLEYHAQLMDHENANLRKLLLWCAARMLPDHISELRRMINAPLEEGGVHDDQSEEDREYLLALYKAIERVTDAIELTIRDPEPEAHLATLDAAANALRGYLNEEALEPTIHELRQRAKNRPKKLRKRQGRNLDL